MLPPDVPRTCVACDRLTNKRVTTRDPRSALLSNRPTDEEVLVGEDRRGAASQTIGGGGGGGGGIISASAERRWLCFYGGEAQQPLWSGPRTTKSELFTDIFRK